MSVASATQEQGLRLVQRDQNAVNSGTMLREVSSYSGEQDAAPSVPITADLPYSPNSDILNQPPSPPHNYRHSRAYRHFKNPPQPHMCIRVNSVSGEEVFINVLSWTRIVVPQEPTDPIPLYGGMKVPPGSPRCPPLVYAVMANPEVLKDSGRHSKDAEERRAMVELMCDFVEAMNPDLRLNRNAVILKDRDISGELKDVWNAVQAQRDREREEQMMQQHNHVPPPQQLFLPQKPNTVQNPTQTPIDSDNNDLEPNSASFQNNTSRAPINSADQTVLENTSPPTEVAQSAITNNANNIANSVNDARDKVDTTVLGDLMVGADQTDSSKLIRNGAKNPDITNSVGNVTGRSSKISNNVSTCVETSPATVIASGLKLSVPTTQTATSPVSPTNVSSSTVISPAASSSSTIPINTTSAPTTTKKEKLGGFLPNSCIFPRFKNKNKDKNKEKDKEKDKDKDKEKSNSHNSKEKTLLHSLKKTTSAATNAFTKSQTHNEDSSSNAVKNCLNLEAEVEKLDLNKIDTPHAADVLIKVAAPIAK